MYVLIDDQVKWIYTKGCGCCSESKPVRGDGWNLENLATREELLQVKEFAEKQLLLVNAALSHDRFKKL